MVDFSKSALIGLAAAGIVAGAMVGLTAAGFAVAVTLPLWGAMLVTAGVAIGIGAAVDHFVDTDRIMQKVTDGFSAWGGIFDNVDAIASFVGQRAGEAIPDATQETGNSADADK